MRWCGLLALCAGPGCSDGDGSTRGELTGAVTSATTLGASTGAPTSGGEGPGSSGGEAGFDSEPLIRVLLAADGREPPAAPESVVAECPAPATVAARATVAWSRRRPWLRR